MNYKELSQFYSSISFMWKCGVPAVNILETMKQGLEGPKFRLLDRIQDILMRGQSLSRAMARFPRVFDDFQVSIIEAAELSGRMDETCKGLAEYYEQRYNEKKRLSGSLVYPVILMHGALLLPPLKYLFLPSLGKSYGTIVLPPLCIAYLLIILGIITWKKYYRPGGRLRDKVDSFLLSLPFVGKLLKDFSISRVLRSFAYLLEAGIENVKAARKAAVTAANHEVKRELLGALPILENNGTITGYFTFSGLLDTNQLGVVSAGEISGTLVESLLRMVRIIDRQNSQRFTSAIKTIGYSAYFIATGIVAYIVISFFAGYSRF